MPFWGQRNEMTNTSRPQADSAARSLGRAIALLLIGAGMQSPFDHRDDAADPRVASEGRSHRSDSVLASIGRAIVAPLLDGRGSQQRVRRNTDL